jgi:hypothetical protein
MSDAELFVISITRILTAHRYFLKSDFKLNIRCKAVWDPGRAQRRTKGGGCSNPLKFRS